MMRLIRAILILLALTLAPMHATAAGQMPDGHAAMRMQHVQVDCCDSGAQTICQMQAPLPGSAILAAPRTSERPAHPAASYRHARGRDPATALRPPIRA